MNFLSTVVKPTWDANSDIAGGFSSFIEGLAGVPATVRHLTALNAKHGHVTLKTDVVFVWAVDLCVVFEPTDRHGLRAGDSALNLHQFTLHVLNVLWGLFGEHWRVFTLWKQEKTVMWAEEVWFFFTQRNNLKASLSARGEVCVAQVEIPLTVISEEQESFPMSLEAWQKYFPVSALSAFRMVRWGVFSTQPIL